MQNAFSHTDNYLFLEYPAVVKKYKDTKMINSIRLKAHFIHR